MAQLFAAFCQCYADFVTVARTLTLINIENRLHCLLFICSEKNELQLLPLLYCSTIGL